MKFKKVILGILVVIGLLILAAYANFASTESMVNGKINEAAVDVRQAITLVESGYYDEARKKLTDAKLKLDQAWGLTEGYWDEDYKNDVRKAIDVTKEIISWFDDVIVSVNKAEEQLQNTCQINFDECLNAFRVLVNDICDSRDRLKEVYISLGSIKNDEIREELLNTTEELLVEVSNVCTQLKQNLTELENIYPTITYTPEPYIPETISTTLIDETIQISQDSYVYYTLNLVAGETLQVYISTDGAAIDVYLMDSKDFAEFEDYMNGYRASFHYYDLGTVNSVVQKTYTFVVPESGTYYLVLDNTWTGLMGEAYADRAVNVYVNVVEYY